MKSLQSSIALFCVFLLLVPGAFAQQQQQQVNMPGAVLAPKETHWYTPLARKYTPFEVAPINLANSSRLESLIRAGNGGNGPSSNGTIITSTGTQLPNLDPVFFTNYTWAHSTNLQSSSFASGTPTQVFEAGNTSFGIQQGFLSGTTATVGYTGQNL